MTPEELGGMVAYITLWLVLGSGAKIGWHWLRQRERDTAVRKAADQVEANRIAAIRQAARMPGITIQRRNRNGAWEKYDPDRSNWWTDGTDDSGAETARQQAAWDALSPWEQYEHNRDRTALARRQVDAYAARTGRENQPWPPVPAPPTRPHPGSWQRPPSRDLQHDLDNLTAAWDGLVAAVRTGLRPLLYGALPRWTRYDLWLTILGVYLGICLTLG